MARTNRRTGRALVNGGCAFEPYLIRHAHQLPRQINISPRFADLHVHERQSNDAEQHVKAVALNVTRTSAHHRHILVIVVLMWMALPAPADAYR